MSIINSFLSLNKELSETKRFNFDEYKLIGRQIAFLSYDEQKYFVKILMEESIQNINFTFYTFILQEYIHTIKILDSYDVENISKMFVDNILVESIHLNLIKFIDFLYPIDWSVLISNNITIVTKCLLYLSELNNINITEMSYASSIIDLIEYIVKKGNFINDDDTINVHILYQNIYSSYPRLYLLKKYFQYASKTDIENVFNMVSSNKEHESIVDRINDYCVFKKLDVEEMMNIRNSYNLSIYCYAKNYKTFKELFECKMVRDKNLYRKNLYKIIYENVNDDNFINEYLGLVELDDVEKMNKHNNEIKNIIAKYVIPAKQVWEYII
jgi:hypothetical protein